MDQSFVRSLEYIRTFCSNKKSRRVPGIGVSGGTGIIKTALKTPEFVKPVVEHLIQVQAQVESLGNLVYTRAILKKLIP